MIALGNCNAQIKIYIENKPPLEPYQSLNYCLPLAQNDIATIAKETGNHWRKIFNVYAKLVFELSPQSYDSWQQLRDLSLLQQDSAQCLVFSAPLVNSRTNKLTNQVTNEPPDKLANELSIIMGKTYATKLGIVEQCHWLTPYFAINQSLNIIICPYFDYRQLSNEKITQLVALIKQLS